MSKMIPLENTLRRAIASSGFSQAGLAELTGLSQGGISRFVAGKNGLNLRTYVALVRCFGLEIKLVSLKKRK